MPKLKWRKPANLKVAHLHVRAAQDQMRRWHAAAKKERRSLSSWVVSNLDKISLNTL